MTNAEQTEYWYKYNRFTKSKAALFLPQVNKALREQINFFAKTRNIDLIPMQPIADVVKRIYVETGRLWAHTAYISIRQQKARQPIGFNEEMIQRILQYFQLRLLEDAVIPITQTTQDFIRDALSKGISEGQSIDDIVNEIIKSDITLVRAKLIARTEIAKAANLGAELGVQKTGLRTNKLWVAARDSRTRHDHMEADGQTVASDQPFVIGAERWLMQRPMDSRSADGRKVPASEIINCRCILGHKVIRGTNGLPLRN